MMKRVLPVILAFMLCVSAAMAEGWTWTSSDESVVRVWPDGTIVVAGIGTATLTGTAQDGSGETVTIMLTVPEGYAAADSETPYVGNRKSKKFHHFECTSVNDIKEGNKEPLASREDAIDKGYVPCGRCDP